MAAALSNTAEHPAQSQSRMRVPDSEGGPTSRAQRSTVLIVDDNPGDRELYSELIGGLALRIREASTADEAISECEQELPSCALIDYGLPGADGIELVRMLRERYAACDLPLIILTGRGDEGLAVSAMKAGASDYISKQQALVGTELARVIGLALERAHSLRLEQRLEQSERLAALGQLAAGVAHEINNPANFVLVNLGQLEERLANQADGEEGRELLALCKDSLEGVRRIADIVREMHRFSRMRPLDPQPVQLEEVINAAIRLLAGTMRLHASVETRFEFKQQVVADRSKLLQVLVNLLDNAAKAVGAQGVVRIATQKLSGRVQVRVEDSGPGIPLDMRERVFEPFFTSRTAGLGLGLALCREYVRRHSGQLWVEDSSLGGACFVMELPFETGLTVARPEPAENGERQTEGRRVRFLLVDDEPQILRAFKRALNQHCEIEVAGSVEAALSVLEQSEFDAVVCDISMPGLGGVDLYRWLLDNKPELASRLLFCSGGILSPDIEREVARTERVLLQKPIEPLALLHAVRIAVEAEQND
ncbi:MAG: response regulator [Polyangiaceae bacterium]|nr:response regulator [Polyangiaceae bacterium]